jgi:hypothetical protein
MLFPSLTIRALQRGVRWKSEFGLHAAANYTINYGSRVIAKMTRSNIEEISGEAAASALNLIIVI